MVACPICENPFSADSIGGVTVARCDGCDGLWLAHGDLDRLAGRPVEAELHETATAPNECRYCQSQLGFGDTCLSCGKISTMHCPRGHGVMHVNLIVMGEREFEVDGCPSCRGMWIDGHERRHVVSSTHDPRKSFVAPPSGALGRARRSYALDQFERDSSLFPHRHEPLRGKELHLAALLTLLTLDEHHLTQRPGKSQPLLLPMTIIVLALAGFAIYFFVIPLLAF